MRTQGILFFADRLPPLTGGMEMHAHYFIKHFAKHQRYPLVGLISKDGRNQDCQIKDGRRHLIHLRELPKKFDPTIVFFNSGRWIEEMGEIRKMFPSAMFFYRTGGNEILKAPLIKNQIPDHLMRQSFWVEVLNDTVDLIITNSSYTESRLRKLGISTPFSLCVGGVNTSFLKSQPKEPCTPFTFFCAARFVPYKNHLLLLEIAEKLTKKGHVFQLHLAGDGPLLEEAKKQAAARNLGSVVQFLGVLDNENTCCEIAKSDAYLQLSGEKQTSVLGGSYIHSEGMGRSILEAISAGTFVIAGQGGALPEIVKNKRGILVDLEDRDNLLKKIEEVIKSPPKKAPFTDTFSWSNLFKRYEETFEKAN